MYTSDQKNRLDTAVGAITHYIDTAIRALSHATRCLTRNLQSELAASHPSIPLVQQPHQLNLSPSLGQASGPPRSSAPYFLASWPRRRLWGTLAYPQTTPGVVFLRSLLHLPAYCESRPNLPYHLSPPFLEVLCVYGRVVRSGQHRRHLASPHSGLFHCRPVQSSGQLVGR